MNKNDMVVQGKKVNPSVIAAYARRVGSLDEILSVWANAGAIQLAEHGNMNWLAKLFDMPVLRLKNNDLSKLGTEVRQYISAHYPAVKWDAENQKLVRSKVSKESVQATHFVDLTITDASKVPAEQNVVEQRGKFWRPIGDFSMTLIEWRNRDTGSGSGNGDDETAPTVTAKAFMKQADKALTALEGARFVGAADELQAAAEKAKSLYLMLEAQIAKAVVAGKVETLDADKAAELLDSGRKGKSARAGGKVDDQKEAA